MKSYWPSALKAHRNAVWTALVVSGLVLFGVLSTCSPKVPLIKRVHSLGVLRVATFNSPTTYYVGPAGPTGFEYDLTRAFAQELGLELEILVAESPAEVIELVQSGRAHMGAGLPVTPAAQQQVYFTQPLRSAALQLVYRSGSPKPKSLDDLGAPLVVSTDSAAAQTLRDQARTNPKVVWQETDDYGPEELLYRVANAQAEYTICSSELVDINQRYYPQLRVAFTLTDFQNVAWAFAPGDDSLSSKADAFLKALDPGLLAQVRDRYFGHIAQVGSFGALALATHTQTRLPRYRKAFEEAATRYGLDWRLLASIGYQESMWDPAAISPTGVRGLMQITSDTAEFLNIGDRLDPKQSIYGAARYLQQIRAKLPPEIPEPDRTWMALAAYNVGYGHLLDARDITQLQGGDPNRWVEVRNNLPLLTQTKWLRKTKYGYARGHEAVTYVGNIRTYYDMLSWITGGKVQTAEQAPAPVEPKKKPGEPLNINSPVL